jgi:hypothetical protein
MSYMALIHERARRGMSIMNFMVYCNGIIFFHKYVDCMGYS